MFRAVVSSVFCCGVGVSRERRPGLYRQEVRVSGYYRGLNNYLHDFFLGGFSLLYL